MLTCMYMKRKYSENGDCPEGIEAGYYEVMAEGTVQCSLCPHHCRLTDGKRGLCRSRINVGGRLMALSYGRVCSLSVDPVEKKPLYHFHPGEMCLSLAAAGCNLSCLNCQNWTISQVAPEDARSTFIAPEELPALAARVPCSLVAYTYTEPLTWMEYTVDCARACREAGLQNILVSAGYVCEEPLDDLLPYLDAANIDLKSFSDDVYRRISHASLSPVLRTLEKMRDAGVWLEITNLLIPGVNDDSGMIRAMCLWLADNGFAEFPLHFSRFFPRYRMHDVPPTPLKTLRTAENIARECGIRHVYLGNV